MNREKFVSDDIAAVLNEVNEALKIKDMAHTIHLKHGRWYMVPRARTNAPYMRRPQAWHSDLVKVALSKHRTSGIVQGQR